MKLPWDSCQYQISPDIIMVCRLPTSCSRSCISILLVVQQNLRGLGRQLGRLKPQSAHGADYGLVRLILESQGLSSQPDVLTELRNAARWPWPHGAVMQTVARIPDALIISCRS